MAVAGYELCQRWAPHTQQKMEELHTLENHPLHEDAQTWNIEPNVSLALHDGDLLQIGKVSDSFRGEKGSC